MAYSQAVPSVPGLRDNERVEKAVVAARRQLSDYTQHRGDAIAIQLTQRSPYPVTKMPCDLLRAWCLNWA